MVTTISLATLLSDQLNDNSKLTVIDAERTEKINQRLDEALQESQRDYLENEAEAKTKLAQYVLTH